MMTSHSDSSTNWGLGFLILLIFFAIFSGRGLFGNNAYANDGRSSWTPAQIAETSAWNRLFEQNADTKCIIEKNDAVLKGDLDVGFRTVINNADNNKNEILLADERRENQNLRDRVIRLEAEGDKKDILLAIERSESRTQAQITDVRCNMLPKPQVTGIGCSPCVVNPRDCGNGFV